LLIFVYNLLVFTSKYISILLFWFCYHPNKTIVKYSKIVGYSKSWLLLICSELLLYLNIIQLINQLCLIMKQITKNYKYQIIFTNLSHSLAREYDFNLFLFILLFTFRFIKPIFLIKQLLQLRQPIYREDVTMTWVRN
jgi:hypothetical protein